MKKNIFPAVFILFFISGCAPGSVILLKNLSTPLADFRTAAVGVECSDTVPADSAMEAAFKVNNMIVKGLNGIKKFRGVFDYQKEKNKAGLWIKVQITGYNKVNYSGMNENQAMKSGPARVNLDVSFIDADTGEIIGEADFNGESIRRSEDMTEAEMAASFAVSSLIDFIVKN